MHEQQQLDTKQPVFLVGPLRSGTTMLRLMIDHHPQVAFPNESEFLTQFIGGDGTLPLGDDYRRLLPSSRVFRALNLSTGEGLDYIAQCNSFLEQYLTDKSGATIVGTTVHNHFDWLPVIWPKARYIHLLRDGRDVARSAINMGWVGTVYEGADLWINTERTWDRLEARVQPSQTLAVRYESLLADPEGELRKVCEFIGVDFAPEMLRYYENSTYEPPNPKLAYQWRTKQSPAEVGLVESKLADWLTSRGYELSGHPIREPSSFERLSMQWRGRLHRLRFNLKRNGLGLTLADQLSRRLGLDGWQKTVRRRLDDIEQAHLK